MFNWRYFTYGYVAGYGIVTALIKFYTPTETPMQDWISYSMLGGIAIGMYLSDYGAVATQAVATSAVAIDADASRPWARLNGRLRALALRMGQVGIYSSSIAIFGLLGCGVFMMVQPRSEWHVNKYVMLFLGLLPVTVHIIANNAINRSKRQHFS